MRTVKQIARTKDPERRFVTLCGLAESLNKRLNELSALDRQGTVGDLTIQREIADLQHELALTLIERAQAVRDLIDDHNRSYSAVGRLIDPPLSKQRIHQIYALGRST